MNSHTLLRPPFFKRGRPRSRGLLICATLAGCSSPAVRFDATRSGTLASLTVNPCQRQQPRDAGQRLDAFATSDGGATSDSPSYTCPVDPWPLLAASGSDTGTLLVDANTARTSPMTFALEGSLGGGTGRFRVVDVPLQGGLVEVRVSLGQDVDKDGTTFPTVGVDCPPCTIGPLVLVLQ